MKKLLTIIALMFCLVTTQAQNISQAPITMNQQNSSMKASIIYVFNQLKASDSEFSLGVHMEYCAGAVLVFGGVTDFLMRNKPDNIGRNIFEIALGFTGVFGTAGSILLIDSHKFIRRMALTPVGLSITF
jgi:hypothetical protein